MRWTSLVVLALGIAGCKGEEPVDDTDLDDTPFDYDLGTQARALSASASLPQSAVDAHAAVTTLMSVSLMAAAEPVAQAAMGHDAPKKQFCWEIKNQIQTSFDILYSACQNAVLKTNGSIRYRQVLEGYKVFEFLGLDVNGRKLGGALGLDGSGAPDMSFVTYDTLADDPSPDVHSPMGITIGNSQYSISWSGGMQLDPDNNQLLTWGVGEVGSMAGIATVRVGGTDADLLTSAEPPPDALAGNLNFVDCRCPTSGLVAYELPIRITGLVVDLDDLQPVDDGVDDPEIELVADTTIQGEFVVDSTGCGEYDLEVRLDQSTLSVPVAGMLVGAAIQKQCDALLIDDDEKCEALVGIASRVGTFQFEVDGSIVTEAANNDALARFGGGWCRF